MSPPRHPQLGSVVWAELKDSNGFTKIRPAVVVTPTADFAGGKPIRVVAITTRLLTPYLTIMCCCLGIGKGKRAPVYDADAPPWPAGRR